MTMLGLHFDPKCNCQIWTNQNRVIFDPVFVSVQIFWETKHVPVTVATKSMGQKGMFYPFSIIVEIKILMSMSNLRQFREK